LPWRKMFRSQFWKGCLLGFVSLTVLLTAMRFAGVFYFGKIGLRGAEILQWAAMYTVAFILVGLREEFENRGYGLFTLSAGIGYWPAAMVTSAYFLYRHTSNAGENWVGLLNVGLFGLLSCLILRRTGNLWMPIGFHAAWDWGESYFYGVADSGAALPGHLLNSSSKGPDLLTGGSVGPEGSIFATLLLVVLWFAVAAVFRETKFPGSSTDGARRVP
jgi:membrane protease YdiL (CAAX protease family)